MLAKNNELHDKTLLTTNVSVIIPTYNRHQDLIAVIESILIQSVLPKEVIVVDCGDDGKAKQMVSTYTKNEKPPVLIYLQCAVNSSAVARNIGAKNANGTILLFLDDDVILDKHYIKEMSKVFYEYSTALIVQGSIINNKSQNKLYELWTFIWQVYAKFFFLFHCTDNKKEILPSGKNTAPSKNSNIINCQWASGCCLGIKKEIFGAYTFDDKLIKYCYCEDADLSYRIYKNNPKSIYQTPMAKLVHKGSFNKSSPVKQAVILEKTYNMYFVAKNLGKSINYILFFWSEFGMFLQDVIFSVIFIGGNGKYFFLRSLYSLHAYYICIRHFSKINKLDIEYINNRYLR